MTKNDLIVPSYQEESRFPWVIELEAREKYRLWLRYSDGTEGVVDLSDMAHTELFADWQKPGIFEQVVIGEYGEIVWTDDASLCADSLYLDLTNQ
jgi:hypothetical protein